MAESLGLLLQESTTVGNKVRELMDRATIRESLWFFQELMGEYREVMIVAKGIRQGVSLIRQGRELARLDRLQYLELMPQIFHLLAPFM